MSLTARRFWGRKPTNVDNRAAVVNYLETLSDLIDDLDVHQDDPLAAVKVDALAAYMDGNMDLQDMLEIYNRKVRRYEINEEEEL